MNDDLMNTQEDLERARYWVNWPSEHPSSVMAVRLEEVADLIHDVRAEAQQEMRDRGFQHPDDVAAMILSTDKRAREQSSARLAAAEKLAQALQRVIENRGERDKVLMIAQDALWQWEATGK